MLSRRDRKSTRLNSSHVAISSTDTVSLHDALPICGAVIRFRCGEYTSLAEPRAVQYQSVRPEITTVKEQLNALLHNESVNARERFLDKFLIKPVQANAEQEWRCFRHATDEPSSKQPDDRPWYDDHPFERAEVGVGYFGACMDIEAEQKLISIQ